MAKAAKVDNVLEFDLDAIRAREAAVLQETDDEIIDRMRTNFQILDDMTQAVKAGDVRAMIVSGPPGVGKSHGVEQVLSKDDLFDTLGARKPKYEIVKGNMSALGLFCKLHQHSEENHVVVFDDCDTILFDEVSLNLLKGALDSGDKRVISWNTDSRVLRNEGIPDKFDFRGAAIFITNIKFAHVRSKKMKDHLAALESRCHYIDLEMDTKREKLLRIRQVVSDGMLDKYDFGDEGVAQVLDYVEDNAAKLRELSLRMVLKLADLKRAFPNSWERMAQTTCQIRGA